MEFNGSCELDVTGLYMSQHGFSVELAIQPSSVNSWQYVLEERTDRKFAIQIQDQE